MTVKVAINGFGRIGRNILRAIYESGRKDIEVVAVNDLGPVETNAHLFRYDSVHGRFPGVVTSGEDWIDVGMGKIRVTAIRDPKELPHKDLGVDIAFECTGIFTAKDKASAHLAAGARRVLVSAPADGADKTIVYKVNDDTLTADDIVVSNGSCTTNALAPVTDQAHNDLWSVTKSVISMLTGIAAHEGSLRLDDPIGNYLPKGAGWGDRAHRAITIRQLLTQTSGLDQAILSEAVTLGADPSLAQEALAQPLKFAPGTVTVQKELASASEDAPWIICWPVKERSAPLPGSMITSQPSSWGTKSAAGATPTRKTASRPMITGAAVRATGVPSAVSETFTAW